MELRQTRITALSSSPQPTDFTLLSDGTENYSLNRSLYVEGEQWTVEGQANESMAYLGKQNRSKTADEKDDEAVSNADAGPEGDWTPLLLLVPLRLGRDRFNMAYFPSLTDTMSRPDCVGVIGGRPRHSLYFVGFQDDNLLHMDPHLVWYLLVSLDYAAKVADYGLFILLGPGSRGRV